MLINANFLGAIRHKFVMLIVKIRSSTFYLTNIIFAQGWVSYLTQTIGTSSEKKLMHFAKYTTSNILKSFRCRDFKKF